MCAWCTGHLGQGLNLRVLKVRNRRHNNNNNFLSFSRNEGILCAATSSYPLRQWTLLECFGQLRNACYRASFVDRSTLPNRGVSKGDPSKTHHKITSNANLLFKISLSHRQPASAGPQQQQLPSTAACRSGAAAQGSSAIFSAKVRWMKAIVNAIQERFQLRVDLHGSGAYLILFVGFKGAS